MSNYALRVSPAEVSRYRLMAAVAERAESDLWQLAGIAPGARIADIGCGPGAISAVLSGVVGPSGHVCAVDGDAGVVEVARASLESTGLRNWSTYVAAADSTGLEPSSFDVVMIRHVLAHNGGREEAIVKHAASLLSRSGVLYLVDADITTITLYPNDADVSDLNQRYVEFHRKRGNNPQAGLELPRLLREVGLNRIAYRGFIEPIEVPVGFRPPAWAAIDAMVDAGHVTGDDVERWHVAMERLDGLQPRPFLFPPAFVALGAHPARAS
jgi:SAM-dependent methyltransferase